MTKYERDPELVNFLSKVEDLNSKRYSNIPSSKPAGEALSPVRSHNSGEYRRADMMTGKMWKVPTIWPTDLRTIMK